MTSKLSRRQVLKSMAGTGIFLLLPMLPSQAVPADLWVDAGSSEKFRQGQPQRVSLPNNPVLFLTRMEGGHLAAVTAKCTHKGCEVFWNKAAAQLSCPCHGAAFAPDGANLHGPRSGSSRKLDPLASVQVRETDGHVEVNFAPAAK